MKNYFYKITDIITENLKPNEIFLARLGGENSDFIRINNSSIRQAGNVYQCYIDLVLINGKKHSSKSIIISGNLEIDKTLISETISDLRTRFQFLPDDPYLLYSENVNSNEEIGENFLPDSKDALSQILECSSGKDLVGIYAAGSIFKGFSNSFGQKNWFEKHSFNFDWSLYHNGDKAVKSDYSGFKWDSNSFSNKMKKAISELNVISKNPITIKPGKYRVYLSPSALEEFTRMLSWGGFGLKSQKTKDSPLIKMIDSNINLSPNITIIENIKDGISPNFQEDGFIKPDKVFLIKNGKFNESLISPRSAKEYGVQTNAANGGESPDSLEITAGDLPQERVLETLGTGIYMNNAWYLNFSDRNACRITGMTRFACFWVENGKIVAPINVMRFDETLLKMLGENLIGLTSEQDLLLSSSSYYARTTYSSKLPGAIIKDFTFTL